MTNHTLAFPEAVEKYLNTEINFNVIVGLLEVLPFHKLHVSAIMTRPKPDGSYRLIVDLSWPQGNSINSLIPANMFNSHPLLSPGIS